MFDVEVLPGVRAVAAALLDHGLVPGAFRAGSEGFVMALVDPQVEQVRRAGMGPESLEAAELVGMGRVRAALARVVGIAPVSITATHVVVDVVGAVLYQPAPPAPDGVG